MKIIKNAKFNLFLSLFLLLFVFKSSLMYAQDVQAFKHVANSNNIQNNWTVIDNPLTNNSPNKILIVTHDYGTNGPYVKSAIGVWYTRGKWAIYNEDKAKMPPSAKFNVMVFDPATKKAPQVQVNANVKCQVAMIDASGFNGNGEWWGKWHDLKLAKKYKETPCTFSGLKPGKYVLVAYNPASVNFDPNNGDPAQASDGVVLEEVVITTNSKLSYNFSSKDFKDWNCLSCPWLYAFDGQKFVRLTEVIQDVVGEENCQTTRHEISSAYIIDHQIKFRIQEEKEETSYLDRISLTVDGKKVMPVKTELTQEDKNYLVLEKGDFIDLTFDLSDYSSGDHEIIFECNGFYIPKTEFLNAVYDKYLLSR